MTLQVVIRLPSSGVGYTIQIIALLEVLINVMRLLVVALLPMTWSLLQGRRGATHTAHSTVTLSNDCLVLHICQHFLDFGGFSLVMLLVRVGEGCRIGAGLIGAWAQAPIEFRLLMTVTKGHDVWAIARQVLGLRGSR